MAAGNSDGKRENRQSSVLRGNSIPGVPRLPDQVLELIAVILLSVASLGAAWAGYQSTRWGGEQSTLYSQAGAIRVESSRASTIGYMLALGDLTVFNAWAEATAAGDQALIDFHERRFSPELRQAVDTWLATDPLNNPDAPGGPFEAGLYSNSLMEEAETLEVEAAATFDEGREASQQGDDYVMITVIFAMVLFFGGISSRVYWYNPKLIILGFAAALLAFGLVEVVLFPVL